MDGYLVLFCGSMDDIPVLLTADRGEAFRVAGEIKGPDDPRVRHGLEVMWRDVGTPSLTCVIEIKDGVPAEWTMVNDLDAAGV